MSEEMIYDKLLEYIDELIEKQDVVGTVNLNMTKRMLIQIKPHFLKWFGEKG